MVTKNKTTKTKKRISAERKRVLERQKKLKHAAMIAEKTADAAFQYAKKQVTKENAKKAIAASKKVTNSLVNLFKKKKAVPQRTTMTLSRK